MAKKISTLANGSLIKDTASTYYGKPIIWKIADKNHSGYPSNSVTLITEKIIKIAGFDGKEASNADSSRKSYGNNRYRTSNLRQWLNSGGAASSWWTAQNLTDGTTNTNNKDAVPTTANMNNYNGYDTEAGFMTNLSAEFAAALLTTTLTVAKNTVTDGGSSETVQDKIFLASTTEVGLANENSIAEGSALAIFSSDSSRIAYPTSEAVTNSTYSNSNLTTSKGWSWWLRTPYAAYSYNVRGVNAGGALNFSGAYYGGWGVRPLCNLSSDILVSDTADSDGAYTIIWNQPPTITSDKTGDLGTLDSGFTCNYSVNDADESDSVSVTLDLDGVQISTFTATKNQQETYTLGGNEWLKVTNGEHTFTITASDGKDASTNAITFTRNLTELTVTLAQPFPADDVISACALNVEGSIPADAVCKYEVTNNANDTEPVWEDCTKKSQAGFSYVFTNKTAENGFAFNFRVTISRGASGSGGYITGVSGGFE